MAKPTTAQLAKINRFTRNALQEDEVEVYDNLMIDTRPIMDRGLIVSPELLRVFLKDISKGVPQLMVHDTSLLPVGKVFEGRLAEETVDGESTLTLYGTHYVPKGLKVTGFESMLTDDLINMVNTGVLTDTSIGFSSQFYECSICHNDIRDWRRCEHIPLRQYVLDDEIKTCFAIAREKGGNLRENSYVYAGACDRASILSADGSIEGSTATENSHLYPVTDLKRVPLDAEVTMRFSAGSGITILSNKPLEDGNLTQEVQGMTFEELKQKYDELQQENGKLSTELTQKSGELTKTAGELRAAQEALGKKETEVNELTQKVDELTGQVNTLSAAKETADKYVSSLKTEAAELSVKLRGNDLSAERYAKYLDSLSLTDLEAEVAELKTSVQSAFGGEALATGEGEEGAEVERPAGELSYSDMSEEEKSEHLMAETKKLMAEKPELSYKDASVIALQAILEKEGK